MIDLAVGVVTFASFVAAMAWVAFCLEAVMGLNPRSAAVGHASAGSVMVLIPAHDEAEGICHTIRKLKQVSQNVGILVIADNCTDSTARQAASAGALVVERTDPTKRGKGYALDFGRSWLAADPPSVIIVLDADCELTPGTVERLFGVASRGFAAQAVNTLLPDRSANPMVQISSFAFLIKNRIRALGLARTGGATILTGTGMAFSWSLFSTARLAGDDIVEDLRLTIDLVRQGHYPQLVGGAHVLSRAADVKQSRVQRTRWEHGFLSTFVSSGLPLLAEAIITASRQRFFLALHLLVPPLTLLVAVTLLLLVLGSGLSLINGDWSTPVFLAIALLFGLAVTAVAWLKHGRDTLTLHALLRVPHYVLWKIPIYLKFLLARETEWQRTPRSGEAD